MDAELKKKQEERQERSKSILQEAKQQALELHGERRSPGAYRDYLWARETILATLYRHTMTQMDTERAEQDINCILEVMRFTAKKLGSRAKVVKHLVALPAKYEKKFGRPVLSDYIDNLHAEALVAHQLVFGRRALVAGKSFNEIIELAA